MRSEELWFVVRWLHSILDSRSTFNTENLLFQGTIMVGSLPTKALKLIREWMAEHYDELQKDWERAVAYEPLEKIAGADND